MWFVVCLTAGINRREECENKLAWFVGQRALSRVGKCGNKLVCFIRQPAVTREKNVEQSDVVYGTAATVGRNVETKWFVGQLPL